MAITNGSTNGNGNHVEALEVPRHRLRNGLAAGKSMFGCFSSFAGSWPARIIASCDWDYVIVDCEHGNHDDSSMHDAVNAIAAEGVSPIVRIRGQDAGLIKRALDTGAHCGIMVPMVNTATQAAQVVQWSKFPPMGTRGQGSSFCAMASGITTAQYVQHANDTILTIVQIETPEAIANADAIAAIPGVDALFIGPNDLALSLLGYVPAKWTEQPFLDALETVHQACQKHGKIAGILTRNAAHASQLSKQWPLVGLGSDVKTLQNAMKDILKVARA